ncbi:MAG: cell division protein FtsQ/DivIB [Sphingosinicella sp.]
MNARIARGSQARARPKRRVYHSGGGSRRRRKPRLLESVGFPAGTGRRVGAWIFAGMIVAVAITSLVAFRVPQLAGALAAESIGGVGFTMRRVEIRGANRVSRLAVYNVAFDQPSMAMPSLDLEAIRARLLRFGWVREARVHRRLPDTLVIDIVERQPAAIWQHNRRLALIDAEGVVLEPVQLDAMPELPLVIGPHANRQLAKLDQLLALAPHLRPQVAGASWIGGRRWDVRFQTGEVLALPEGSDAARRALLRFSRMDQQSQLLGRGFVRFDMRIPGRFIVRVSRQPGSRVPTIAPDPGPVPADLARTI